MNPDRRFVKCFQLEVFLFIFIRCLIYFKKASTPLLHLPPHQEALDSPRAERLEEMSHHSERARSRMMAFPKVTGFSVRWQPCSSLNVQPGHFSYHFCPRSQHPRSPKIDPVQALNWPHSHQSFWFRPLKSLRLPDLRQMTAKSAQTSTKLREK